MGRINDFHQPTLTLNPDLQFDPVEKANKLAAQYFEEQGDQLAYKGEVDEAIKKYKQALTLNPDPKFKPVEKANEIAAQYFEEQGDQLAAYQGDEKKARVMYQKALDLNPDLKFDSEKKANEIAAQYFEDKGDQLAYRGEVDEAIKKYKQALTLKPDLKFKPVDKANKRAASAVAKQAFDKFSNILNVYIASEYNFQNAQTLFAPVLIKRGKNLAQKGEIDQAITTIEQALEFDKEVKNRAKVWNYLCWFGSTWKHPETMLPYCELAIKHGQKEKLFEYRDSRGVAYALNNDFKKAIVDFEFYLSSPDNKHPQRIKDRRKEWITDLKQKKTLLTIIAL